MRSMKVSELVRKIGAKELTIAKEDRVIESGYCCDLLSHVMSHGVGNMAWITVQTHMNVIAVAALLDFSCIIIPEGLPVEKAIVEKAQQENIILISTDLTSYEVVSVLAAAGVPAAKKV